MHPNASVNTLLLGICLPAEGIKDGNVYKL